VALLESGAELGERGSDYAVLGVNEPLQIMGVGFHAAIMAIPPAAGKSGSRLLVRREQPREYVEEDHHRACEQRRRNEAQANDGRVDSAIIGKTGGDAHDLCVAAVDQETSIHLHFL